ncbi:MAG TPA: tetratricopeptide repeat protein [Casimicrobiaceae bacterium]|nr:tetratricopeptide repeat protein [Casimicrobiaceae bacterium]
MKEYAPGIRSSQLSLVEKPTTTGQEEAAPDAEPPPVSERAPSEAKDDRFVAKAREEHAKGQVDSALWARALAQADGDKDSAAGIYLDIRATALRVAKRQERAARRAGVVETLSKEPDSAFQAVTAALNDDTLSTASSPAHGSATTKRKLTILAAGALASAMAIGGVVALWPASGPAHDANAAREAPPKLRDPVAPATGDVSAAPNTVKAAEPMGADVVSRAEALEKEGNWNLLVIYAAEWTRKQPFNPEAWKTLSLGYVKLRQFTEAVDAASKATQLAPDDSRLWRNLGQTNLAVPRPAEALVAFQRATALNDKDIVSLAQEGLIEVQLGHLVEARIAFDKALALSPDDVPALCGAASLAEKDGRAKDAEAMMLQIASRDVRCPAATDVATVRVVVGAPSVRVPAANPSAPNKSAPPHRAQ